MMIIKHELRSYQKTFLIWTVSIITLDFLMLLLYPSLQETLTSMGENYKKMGAFGTAFGMDQLDMATAMGYYGIYIGTMLALCGAMFAAMIGTGVLSKEESGHTAEYLYTLPYSRNYVVFHKIIAILVLLIFFNLLNFIFGLFGLQMIDAEYSMRQMILYHIGQFFLHLEVAAICILISACSKKVNVGLGLGISLLLYFMDMMSRVLDQLKPLKYITPFYYTNAIEIFTSNSISIDLLIIGVFTTIVCLLGSIVIYQKRDLYA